MTDAKTPEELAYKRGYLSAMSDVLEIIAKNRSDLEILRAVGKLITQKANDND